LIFVANIKTDSKHLHGEVELTICRLLWRLGNGLSIEFRWDLRPGLGEIAKRGSAGHVIRE
jgi:hypothetical protein